MDPMEAAYRYAESQIANRDAIIDALNLTIAAICVEAGGAVRVTRESFEHATEVELISEKDGDATIIGVPIGAGSPSTGAVTLSGPGEGDGGEPPPPAPSSVQPIEETEPVELIEEDTTDARVERYLARKLEDHAPMRPRASRRPRMRPGVDQPGDEAYQDVGEPQPERYSEPLSAGDGSVSVSQR